MNIALHQRFALSEDQSSKRLSQLLNSLWWQFMLSTQLIILNYPLILSHRCTTTVSLETCPLFQSNKCYKLHLPYRLLHLSLKNLLVPINTKFHSNSCRQGSLMKYFVCVCVCVCVGKGGGGKRAGR